MRTDTEQSISEVAMNPGSFAAALGSGDVEGVLIGFEFEFCIPYKKINEIYDAITRELFSAYQRNADTVGQYTRDYGFLENRLFEYNIIKFSSIFAIRPGTSKYETVLLGLRSYIDKSIAICRRLFDSMSEKIRAQYSKLALQDLRRYNSGQLRDDIPYALVGLQEQVYKFDVLWYLYHFADRVIIANETKFINDVDIDAARKIKDTIAKIGSGDYLYKFIFGGRIASNREKFNDYFEYDVESAIEFFNSLPGRELRFDSWLNDKVMPGQKNKLQTVLEYLAAKHLGKTPIWFGFYHELKKNDTDWYLEPDGSINAGRNGLGRELVSPPLPPSAALQALQNFYAMAAEGEFYTNKSTGLHINVSIPKKIDPLKLAVFTGDRYVLKQFSRQNNEYAVSVMRSIKSNAIPKNTLGWKSTLSSIHQIASSVMDTHTASISAQNKNYISFRSAGGDYLKQYQRVYNTVGRFVRAMQIASDPDAYKNEYYSKLYAVLKPPRVTPTRAQKLRSEYDKIRALQTQELNAVTITGYLYSTKKQYTVEDIRETVQIILSFETSLKNHMLALSDIRRPTDAEIRILLSRISGNKNLKLTSNENIAKNAFSCTLVLSKWANPFPIGMRLDDGRKYLPGAVISRPTMIGPNDPLHAEAVSALEQQFRAKLQRSAARPTLVKSLPLPESQDTADTLDETIPSPTAPLYYFAYGMLTNPNLMPKPARLIGTAKLQNYKLELLNHANVIEDPSSSVEGALWRVNPAIIEHLDTVEGVPHYYIRKSVEVECAGASYTAQIYVMSQDARDASYNSGYPLQRYIDNMVAGYRVARIPVQQIATALDELEQRLDSGDDNENR